MKEKSRHEIGFRIHFAVQGGKRENTKRGDERIGQGAGVLL